MVVEWGGAEPASTCIFLDTGSTCVPWCCPSDPPEMGWDGTGVAATHRTPHPASALALWPGASSPCLRLENPQAD